MKDLLMLRPNYKVCRIEFDWYFVGKDAKVEARSFMTRAVCVIPDIISGNIQNHSIFMMN